MRKTRVLVVDDELSIVKFLSANLRENGFEVSAAMNGVDALETFEKDLPDLVVLDIMMPKMDGFEVCRRLREWSKTPIIMLSARGDESDKVECLGLGADDYVTKPFGAEELLARVQAVLRRTQSAGVSSSQPAFCRGELKVDFAAHQVTLGEQEVKLTATESAILTYLAQNAGRLITTAQLLEKVWGAEYAGETHILQVNVARLRKKLRDNGRKPRYIQTRPGIGYMLAKSF